MIDNEFAPVIFLFGVLLGVGLIVSISFSTNVVFVNVDALGKKLCESQGFDYTTYTRGENHVPVIHCKVHNTAALGDLYDGLAVVDGVRE